MGIRTWLSNKRKLRKVFQCFAVGLLVLSFVQISFHTHSPSAGCSVNDGHSPCHPADNHCPDKKDSQQKPCQLCVFKHFLSQTHVFDGVSCIEIAFKAPEFLQQSALAKTVPQTHTRKRGPPFCFTSV